MAKSPKKDDPEDGTPAQPSLVVALLILTVIAGGAGAGFAMMFLSSKPLPAATAPAPAAELAKAEDKDHDKGHGNGHGKGHDKGQEHAIAGRFPADAVELALDPIVTSIGPQAKSRMRLEASVMLKKTAGAQPALKKELTEDIVTFLNGVNVEQVSGIRGFQNLREDLNDRAKIRGRGAVLGLLISGFVLE